ncbi:MAG TPA: YegS/Rv2252/BmrU family lipid kinase [Flavisolibacter sp.]|jgi:YegS/Rv2252/BmrU family lipid kinase|nr:YegS/Rv2252/BmrU family lipid kinase [Flavisolibacter sp.]
MHSIEKNIALVVNPFHQKAKGVARELVTLLQHSSIEHTVFTDSWPTTWVDFTEAWIVGGDGTLNFFINRYPQFDLPMVIFKGGTGNDFHWLLYGSLTTAQQFQKVLSAAPQPVDAGLCNRRLFINGVGIGFDGKVVGDLAGKEKRAGNASYLLTVLKNIFQYKSFLCTVNTTDFHWGKKCFMISVANGKRYGGGFRVSPQSLFNDGLLDTNIVGRLHPLRRLQYLPLIQKGKHLDLPFITYVKSSMVVVKALQEVPAHADGEGFSATEFNIECLPGRFFFLY